MRKPVVLFSHLRKKDAKRNYVTMEDLHWSSDLYKQANNVILLESVTDSEWVYLRTKDKEYITRFIIAKNRAAIWGNKVKMYMLFDTNTQSYSREVSENFIDDLINF
jgi:predicted mannosyl-3-phosphoglycerate phosphatase (HAD superfamily)